MSLKNVTTPEKNVAVLECAIDAAAFSAAVTENYNKKKNSIQVPGFRKGKAPRAIVEKMYGKGYFYEDALEQLVPPAYEDALKESGVKAVSSPEYDVTAASEEEGVAFTAKVYVKPEVEIEGYKGIGVTKTEESVTDEDVDARIQWVRKRNSRTTDVDDRPAASGDTANINYEGFRDGLPFEGGKGEDFDLKLGSGTFIPGFEEAVIGHSAGDEFDVNITFPEDYHVEDLAGAAVVFKTRLNSITQSTLPDFDDEFVKDISEFDTVDAYKADVRAKLEKAAAERAENAISDQIVDTLVKKVSGDIPEVMFVNETENQLRDFDTQLQKKGLKLSDYMKYMGLSLNDLRDEMRPKAVKSVKLRLALEKIAQIENIEVTDGEIEDEIKRLSESFSLDIEQVRELVDPDDIRTDLAVDKAMQLCKDNAVITEKPAEADADAAETDADADDGAGNDAAEAAAATAATETAETDGAADTGAAE